MDARASNAPVLILPVTGLRKSRRGPTGFSPRARGSDLVALWHRRSASASYPACGLQIGTCGVQAASGIDGQHSEIISLYLKYLSGYENQQSVLTSGAQRSCKTRNRGWSYGESLRDCPNRTRYSGSAGLARGYSARLFCRPRLSSRKPPIDPR